MKKNVSPNTASTEALQQLIKTGTTLNFAPASIRNYHREVRKRKA